MKKIMENKFGQNTTISGKTQEEYMAQLLEANEKQELEIERGKLSLGILKEMRKRSRLLLDVANFELQYLKEKNNDTDELVFYGNSNKTSDIA